MTGSDAYKVIVAGSRDFDDWFKMEQELVKFLRGRRPSQVEIVSGTARGADQLGEKFARAKGCKLKQMPADWEQFGKSAGYRRNADMAAYADACVVFWDGTSRGTKHMIDLAEKAGIDLKIVKYKGAGR